MNQSTLPNRRTTKIAQHILVQLTQNAETWKQKHYQIEQQQQQQFTDIPIKIFKGIRHNSNTSNAFNRFNNFSNTTFTMKIRFQNHS